MKKIITESEHDTIHISFVNENEPVFAKLDGKLCGMLVNEGDKGWIVRIGGTFGVGGHHPSFMDCIINAQKDGYEFYV